MWPKINHEIVTISLTPKQLSCSWIVPGSSKKPFVLKAYKTTPFDHFEYEQAILFSPTRIGKQINSFLSHHNLKDAFMYACVSGPHIVESLVDVPLSSPKPSDFPFPKLQTLVWDYRYLYPKDNARSAFYLCGIPRHMLFQYNLLAQTHHLNIRALTTQRMALFHLYTHIKGSTFRATQLAQDMQAHNNQLDTFFSVDMLRRILSISKGVSIDYGHETHELATMIGLSIMGDLKT